MPDAMGPIVGNNVHTLRLIDISWSTTAGATARSLKPMPHWFAAEAHGVDTGRGCQRSFSHTEMMFGKNPIQAPKDTSVIPFSGVHFNVDVAGDPF
ncbi:MAG: hypothetical protein WD648_03245 [Planctomycetaceae bacterium]